MRTCQENLVTYCKLPKNWSMNDELNDVQVGMYLGCLYQQQQRVCIMNPFFVHNYFIII
jgi:hypothetical protein